MIIPKTQDEMLLIIKQLYELLDSFEVTRYRTDTGVVKLHKDNKIFGLLDYEKSFYLRIKPLFWCIYPPGSYTYERQRYKMVYLSAPIDKDYILEEINKACTVVAEEA
jgi:hypothetical protein